MYAEWQSIQAYQAMRENPAPLPYFGRALEIAKFEPGMYELVQTFRPRPALTRTFQAALTRARTYKGVATRNSSRRDQLSAVG
jgi:hypothetical protein